ncbi:hypothetical protein IV102_32900 [bacterium]|nr:hypothetical protein [bacterium]
MKSPGNRWWLALFVAAPALVVLALQRILRPGYQFVGNDADLTQYWIYSCKYIRLWLYAGAYPLWNPYVGAGVPLDKPEEFYLSAIHLGQSLLPPFEKSLDFLLVAHALLLTVSTTAFLRSYGSSTLAALAGGVAFALTGTPNAQLFAGHVSLYCALAWTSAVLVSLKWALERKGMAWTLLYSVLLAIVYSYGSLQGFYLVNLLSWLWFGLHLLLGNSQPVQPLGTISQADETMLPRDLGRIWWSQRVRDLGFAFLKLTFAYAVTFHLCWCYWSPQLSSGGYAAVDKLDAACASPLCWIGLFVPHFFLGSGQMYSWSGFPGWEGAPGIGGSFIFLFPLALSLGGGARRQLIVPALMVLFGALIGSGRWLPFFDIYSHLDPWVDLFEVPSRMLLISNFGLSVLLSWSLQQLSQHQWEITSRAQKLLSYLAAGIGLVWVVSYYAPADTVLWVWFVEQAQKALNGSVAAPVSVSEYYVLEWTRFSGEVMLCLALIYSFVRLSGSLRRVAVSLLLAVDLLSYPSPYLNLRPHEDLNTPDYAVTMFREKGLDGLVFNRFEPRWAGQLQLLRQHEVVDFRQIWPGELRSIIQWVLHELPAMEGSDNDKLERPNVLNRMMGVQVYLQTLNGLPEIKKDPTYESFTVYSVEAQNFCAVVDPFCRTRVYLSRNTLRVQGFRDFAREIQDVEKFHAVVNFATVRCYEAMAELFRTRGWQRQYQLDPAVEEKCWIVKEVPNEVHVACLLQAPAMVVLNASYSERWKVAVDGVQEELLPAQMGLNRGVLVDRGSHQIVFFLAHKELDQAIAYSKRALLLLALVATALIGHGWVSRLLQAEADPPCN